MLLYEVGRTTERTLEKVNTTAIDEVRLSFTLEIDLDAFNASAFRRTLAGEYGVPVSAITLDVAGGSVVVSVVVDVAAAAGADPDVTSGAANASDVAAALAGDIVGHNQTLLAGSIGAALNLSGAITISQAPQAGVWTTSTAEADCPAGWWCAGGARTRCERGSYNPHANMRDASACLRCPAESTTPEEAAA